MKSSARSCRRVCLAFLLMLVSGAAVHAQQRLLTIDDIYDPDTKIRFSGTPATGLAWIDRAHFAWPRDAGAPLVDWLRVEATTGRTEPLFDSARMQAAIATLPGVSADEARRLARSRELVFDPACSAALLTIGGHLYHYAFASDRIERITNATGPEEQPSFSPDGRLVAFVRQNNLFVVAPAGGRERELTSDGTADVLNGKLDWVYEEEIFGRGQKRGYWWSPDSSHLAFLRIDDTPVPDFPIVDHIPYDASVEHWRYPKAGDPNPVASLGIVSVGGGAPSFVDPGKYNPADSLVVGVSWTPDSRHVVYQVQNRTQSWLDLNLVEASSRAPRTIVRETSATWIEPPGGDQPIWLRDGSFLWLSERTGWKHLYHYRAEGTLIGQITSGPWEVRALHGADEAAGWIYFAATERSPIATDIYRIRIDGTGMQRLSKSEGTHAAAFAPGLATYLDTWSDATTPPQVRVVGNDGSEIRVVEANPVAVLAEYGLSTPEFLQVRTRDGFVMETMMIKPRGFDPSRRYPVYQFTYGGPHTPQVQNAWRGSEYLYHQLLAQHGILVWICDNRTASGKGMSSTWPVYRNFGELELRDVEDGLAWLKQQPFVDASRIGIHGWSYGGYLTSYALTHSTSFVMGIAGGPVTDWRDYDSVYTERYMGLPQDNAEGYRRSSPRFAAADLHGALLLIHGATDDNVHVQNTLQFAYELQKAQKPFQLMLYPQSRHSVTDPLLAKHLRAMMFGFVLEHLRPEGTPNAPPSTDR
jgi:dipeptidyl-peptidase 4